MQVQRIEAFRIDDASPPVEQLVVPLNLFLINDVELKDYFSEYDIALPIIISFFSVRDFLSSWIGPRRERAFDELYYKWIRMWYGKCKDVEVYTLVNAVIKEKETKRTGLIDSLCASNKGGIRPYNLPPFLYD